MRAQQCGYQVARQAGSIRVEHWAHLLHDVGSKQAILVALLDATDIVCKFAFLGWVGAYDEGQNYQSMTRNHKNRQLNQFIRPLAVCEALIVANGFSIKNFVSNG